MLTRDQIERIYKEIQPHFVRGSDVAGYTSLFTSDAVWWPLNRATAIGPQQIAAGFAAIVEGNHTSPTFEAVEIHIDEDGQTGWAAIHGDITIVWDNGDPTQHVKSREMWMFREVNGEAKICRMLWNQWPV